MSFTTQRWSALWSVTLIVGAVVLIGWQLQRVRGVLLHQETKTEAPGAMLPLPSICVTALKQRR